MEERVTEKCEKKDEEVEREDRDGMMERRME